MEQRFTPSQYCEGKISGYACKWSHPSNILGIGPEVFETNSLTIPKEGVSLYFQHDKKRLLGQTKSGTLKLTNDKIGLKYEATLPKSAQDVIEACQRGDAQGVSLGFSSLDEDRSLGTRRIKKGVVYELSIVDRPQHETTLKIRSKQRKQRWTDLILEYQDV